MIKGEDGRCASIKEVRSPASGGPNGLLIRKIHKTKQTKGEGEKTEELTSRLGGARGVN